MRRKDREVTDFKQIIAIIDECMILRLGLEDGDHPYIVPVNFSYTVNDGEICFYIHGAKAGKKFELLSANQHCSFEMDIPIGLETMEKAGDITMRYKSVMGIAKAVPIEGEEKQHALDNIILARYEMTRNFKYKKESVPATAIFKLQVESISAKANLKKSGPDI